MATQREQSKMEWEGRGTAEDLQLGCLQRIADASEKMAGNYIQLQNDRDWYKKRYYEQQESMNKLHRTISALKGVITKMKKK